MTDEEARHILGVAQGATREELRRAYRDLIKVWHPDRFEGDARLRERAQAAVRRLNQAYAVLQGLKVPEATPIPLAQNSWRQRVGWGARRSRLLMLGAAAAVAGLLIAGLMAIVTRPAPPEAPSPSPGDVALSPPPSDNPRPSAGRDVRARPAPLPEDPFRPPTGVELIAPQSTGRSSLVVYNVARHDAAVVLLSGNEQSHAWYVRSGSKVQLLNVAAGTYRVAATTGQRWRGGRFTADAAYMEFERTVEFREQEGRADVEFTRLTLTVGQPGDGSGFRAANPFLISE